jgi:hypothetical protein
MVDAANAAGVTRLSTTIARARAAAAGTAEGLGCRGTGGCRCGVGERVVVEVILDLRSQAADRRAIVEVMIEPQERSLPPTISLGEVRGFVLYATRTVLSGRGERRVIG